MCVLSEVRDTTVSLQDPPALLDTTCELIFQERLDGFLERCRRVVWSDKSFRNPEQCQHVRGNRDALLACGVRRVRRCASSSGRGRSPSEKIHNGSRCRHVASQAFRRPGPGVDAAGTRRKPRGVEGRYSQSITLGKEECPTSSPQKSGAESWLASEFGTPGLRLPFGGLCGHWAFAGGDAIEKIFQVGLTSPSFVPASQSSSTEPSGTGTRQSTKRARAATSGIGRSPKTPLEIGEPIMPSQGSGGQRYGFGTSR